MTTKPVGRHPLPHPPTRKTTPPATVSPRTTPKPKARYSFMRELIAGLVTLLAPQRCAGCDQPLELTDVFCASCALLVERTSDPSAVFEYGGPVADAIQRFKYAGRSELGAILGALMADDSHRWRGKADAVVPVPLHWRRRRSRGYDQAALLSKPVAKALGVPLLLRGLRRVRNTRARSICRIVRGSTTSRGLSHLGGFAGLGGCFSSTT